MLKTYPRIGDGAPMAFVELVDRPLKREPWALQDQPNSVWPGRGGRKWRASKHDLRDEVHSTAPEHRASRRFAVRDPGSASPGPRPPLPSELE